jgi:hypothetical protein
VRLWGESQECANLVGLNRPGLVEASVLGEDGAMPVRTYPDKMRRRAVRMVFDIPTLLRDQDPSALSSEVA